MATDSSSRFAEASQKSVKTGMKAIFLIGEQSQHNPIDYRVKFHR